MEVETVDNAGQGGVWSDAFAFAKMEVGSIAASTRHGNNQYDWLCFFVEYTVVELSSRNHLTNMHKFRAYWAGDLRTLGVDHAAWARRQEHTWQNWESAAYIYFTITCCGLLFFAYLCFPVVSPLAYSGSYSKTQRSKLKITTRSKENLYYKYCFHVYLKPSYVCALY